jgi:lipoprotein-releasing system permease protein
MIGSRFRNTERRGGTKAIISIAILGIALGVAVMIIAVSVVTGFQNQIRSKVVGFGSHILISDFNFNNPSKVKPISKNADFLTELQKDSRVRNVQPYIEKEGIIKTDEEVQGVIVKGVDDQYDWSFFQQSISKGAPLDLSQEKKNNGVLISKIISQKMKLEVGDPFIVYFIQDNRSRPRKFEVMGIYETGMQQFDQKYVLCDMRHLQRIYGWEDDQVSGLEVILADYQALSEMDIILYNRIPHSMNTSTITSLFPEIFGWLDLQDMNVIIVITLMIMVSGINMIAALLILILEKTSLIGILKAFGTLNSTIRNVFLINAAYLISLGLFWGNLLGLLLCFLQDKFKLLKLPQESYYLDAVPIHFDATAILSLNLGTLILCLAMLLLPALIITKISPVKVIKFN